jgi:glucosyl-dolichyl phosphate glucuronosyltransferase
MRTFDRDATDYVPVVSIIICTRDRAASLERCLTAIDQDKSGAPAEYVVVDNGSSDGTSDLLTQMAMDLRRPLRVIAEPAPGLARARNAGIRVAQGTYMLFTDDDVVVRDGWIDAITAAFSADVIAVGGRILPRFAGVCPPWLHGYPSPMTLDDYGAAPFNMGADRLPLGANMAFRADCLRSRLPNPFEVSLGHTGKVGIGWEETHLLLELCRSNQIRYAPDAVVEHWTDGSRCTYENVRRAFYQQGFGLTRSHRLRGHPSPSVIRRIVRLVRAHRYAIRLAMRNSRKAQIDSASAEKEFLAFMWAGAHVESLFGALPIASERIARAFPAQPLRHRRALRWSTDHRHHQPAAR